MQTMFQSPSAMSSLFSAYASVTATIMLIRTILHQIIPTPLKIYLEKAFYNLFKKKLSNNKLTLVMFPYSGVGGNEIYESALSYLPTIITPSVDRLIVGKHPKQKNFSVTIEKNQQVPDTYQGIKLSWNFVSIEGSKNENSREKSYIELCFDKNFKETVMNDYLPYVIGEAKKIKEKNRKLKLYTMSFRGHCDDDGNGRGMWGGVTLDHPATFETLAMNSDLKMSILEDLEKFLRRKDYYRRVGKAWKRGYLLYGPPGTGKSTLIAAIANHLKFDIYDVELNGVYSDAKLREILLSTSNRSIIVIEDIDCSAEMKNRANKKMREMQKDFSDDFSDSDEGYGKSSSLNKITLSGMLNFADGLWSSCGDERIIIFTTNHRERIDPALLRPGRMDMHIHMSYCTSESLRMLAIRYLGEFDNPILLGKIDGLVESVNVTPAEVAEHLMRSEDPDIALQGVVNFLITKKAEADVVARDENNSHNIYKGNSNEEHHTIRALTFEG